VINHGILPAALLLAGASAVCAQTAVTTGLTHTHDADGFSATRIEAGYLPSYRGPQDYWGVDAGNDHYSQDGWSRDGQQLLGRVRQLDPQTGAGLAVDAGAAHVASRTTFVADASWSARLAPRTGVELIGARDWVDTRLGIEDGITYDFVGASVEQGLGDRFTVIGLAGHQRFSDGNSRNHLRVRLIFALLPEQGVSIQIRHRRYNTDDTTVPRRYFNPERYEQTEAVIALRRRVATRPGWIVSGQVGGGRETIDRTEHKPTTTAELRLDGPFENGWRLDLHAQYLRSAGGVEGVDYWYSLAGVTLTIPLR
jgi:hypothetical protein